jgi:hypothetical protein
VQPAEALEDCLQSLRPSYPDPAANRGIIPAFHADILSTTPHLALKNSLPAMYFVPIVYCVSVLMPPLSTSPDSTTPP